MLIIAITSDRGLAGAFNYERVQGRERAHCQERYANSAEGAASRCWLSARRRTTTTPGAGFQQVGDYTHVFAQLSFDTVRAVAEEAMQGFAAGTYDEVMLVYNEFKNVATQIVRTEQLLPLLPGAAPEAAAAPEANVDYIFEPSKEEIIQTLIPQSLKIQLYKAVLESNASEHGARMTAMDKATDNAGELLKALKLTYNRTRQAAITTEILEIVGGAEALAATR